MRRENILVVISALCFSLFVACSPSRSLNGNVQGPSAGIINGKPVQKDELPYKMTARILSERNGVWYPGCSASILADDLILTAAHCVGYLTPAELRIGFDAQPLSYEGQSNPKTRVDVLAKFKTIEVEGFISHPLYEKSEYDQDMALIRIKGTIPSGFVIASLLNEEQMRMIQPGQTYPILLAGFGLFAESPKMHSEILRQTTVPAKFEGLHLVTDQSGGSGGCNGDSGGPAYLELKGRLYLVGVTHGPKMENPDCHHEGVWGNPNYERSFFNEAAEKLGSKARF